MVARRSPDGSGTVVDCSYCRRSLAQTAGPYKVRCRIASLSNIVCGVSDQHWNLGHSAIAPDYCSRAAFRNSHAHLVVGRCSMAPGDALEKWCLVVTITRNLLALSKPRVIGLLVVTGACGVVKTTDGSPPLVELLAVIVAGTLAAAGANAINQGLDADIDALMSRTRSRPVPSNNIRPSSAIFAGGILVAAAVR